MHINTPLAVVTSIFSLPRLRVEDIKRHQFFEGVDWETIYTASAEGYYSQLEPAPRANDGV